MPESRWFRLPEIGDGTTQNPYRPDYVDRDGVVRWGANKSRDETPHWICKVRGDPAVLDDIANEQQVKDLSELPHQALNGMSGLTRTAEQWDKRW